MRDVVPLPPDKASSLDDVLARYGFRLVDPSMGRVIMKIMTLIGKPEFQTVASLERIGYRPEDPHRAATHYGDVVAAAHGWFRKGRRFHRWVDHPGLMDTDHYPTNPQMAAAHDWWRLRCACYVVRLLKH